MPKEKNKVMTVLYEKEVFARPFKVYGTREEPLFLAKDVAQMLEHKDVTSMIRSIDSEEKLLRTISGAGQRREQWFLTERGLYEVLFRSRKPIAKEFKSKVKDILYSIRTTGQYNTADTSLVSTMEMLIGSIQSIVDVQCQILKRLEHLERPALEVPVRKINYFTDSAENKNRERLMDAVDELAKLTGNTGNGILHQLYVAIEKELDISVRGYTTTYQVESGNRSASPVYMIAATDEVFAVAMDLLTKAIASYSVFK